MTIPFYKYQAAGNDFVLIDNRSLKLALTKEQIARICHRRFGIGADGVILIDADTQAQFHVTYINPDGSQSLCGNGCRTAVHLANALGMTHGQITFNAYDGLHEARLLPDGRIKIKMNNVASIEEVFGGYSLDTGSPHFVKFVDDVKNYPVVEDGRKMRYHPHFPKGTNANYLTKTGPDQFDLRTYERGVEEETLACGTGATASALAASYLGATSPIEINALGGVLTIEFKQQPDGTFTDIYMSGPAKRVFEGVLEL